MERAGSIGRELDPDNDVELSVRIEVGGYHSDRRAMPDLASNVGHVPPNPEGTFFIILTP